MTKSIIVEESLSFVNVACDVNGARALSGPCTALQTRLDKTSLTNAVRCIVDSIKERNVQVILR
jgi:hypothetical protein